MKISVNLLLPKGRYVRAGDDVPDAEMPPHLRASAVRQDSCLITSLTQTHVVPVWARLAELAVGGHDCFEDGAPLCSLTLRP
jgi:hypothetical protein